MDDILHGVKAMWTIAGHVDCAASHEKDHHNIARIGKRGMLEAHRYDKEASQPPENLVPPHLKVGPQFLACFGHAQPKIQVEENAACSMSLTANPRRLKQIGRLKRCRLWRDLFSLWR